MASRKRAMTLHERLVAQLRDEVRTSGPPGTRLATDQELAARYGVSNITVRDAMLVLVEQGWVVRQRGRGTFVADRREQQHVGILTVVDLLHDDIAPMWRQMVRLLREELEREGHPVRLYMGRETPWGAHAKVDLPAFDEAVAAHQLSGLVVVGTEPDARWLDPLYATGVPVVFTGEYRDRVRYCSLPDYRQLGRDTVKALLEQGRERIALLQWVHPRPNDEPTPDLMWQGFSEAMEEAGLEINDAWVRKDLHPSWRGAGWSEFREIWASSRTKPDGLIIGDDMLFPDAAEAIVQLGIRVPEQLLVVAQTNALLPPRLPFPIVAMEYDPQMSATRAAGLIGSLLSGEEPREPVRLVPFRQRWCGFPEATLGQRPVSIGHEANPFLESEPVRKSRESP